MERPTCKTCPYWKQLSEADLYGECRHSPAKHGYLAEVSCNPGTVNISQGKWFDQHEDDWCGKHPDFPAYIASLKPSVADLTTREREVVRLAFGLSPYETSYSRDEIARIFEITPEHARQIEEKAVKILLARRT